MKPRHVSFLLIVFGVVLVSAVLWPGCSERLDSLTGNDRKAA